MSYILDALKKADQERTLGKVPDLEVAHWGERRSKRAYRWAWVVGGLLLINGALLFMLLGGDDAVVSSGDGQSGPTDPMPVTPVPRTESVMKSPPRTIARPREPVYVPPSTPVKRAPTNTWQAPVTPAATVIDQSPPPALVRPVVPAVTPVTTSSVPEWNELSLEFRSGFNLPHIDVHVYSDNPGKRFILVDLQKFREGETLASGAVLEEILPGSIQLFYQGTRFRVEK